jgi:hypothetical protein
MLVVIIFARAKLWAGEGHNSGKGGSASSIIILTIHGTCLHGLIIVLNAFDKGSLRKDVILRYWLAVVCVHPVPDDSTVNFWTKECMELYFKCPVLLYVIILSMVLSLTCNSPVVLGLVSKSPTQSGSIAGSHDGSQFSSRFRSWSPLPCGDGRHSDDTVRNTALQSKPVDSCKCELLGPLFFN